MLQQEKRKAIFRAMVLVFLVTFAAATAQAADATEKNGKTEMPEVKKKVDDALQAIKSYSIDKKDQAMVRAKEMLDEMDARIDELEKRSAEKWQQMNEASREKSQQTLRELRKKRNDLAEWYGGMKQSSADAWGEVKKGFVDSYHTLNEAFDKASKKF